MPQDPIKSPLITNLILQNDKTEVLLMYRQNTGIYDGMWSLPAGPVLNFESPRQAIIREAQEELGVIIEPAFSSVISMRRPDALAPTQLWQSLVFFFHCHIWSGELINNEPKKCQRIEFFPLNNLPHDMVPLCIKGLENFVQEIRFSEYHWENEGQRKSIS